MLRPTIVALFALIPHAGQGCSCVGLASSCDRGWNLGQTIFLGTVVSMEKTATRDADRSISYAAKFTVEESFRGAPAPGAETVIYTGMGGGDCGYPFVAGTRYLVYASASGGRLYTGTCTETTPAAQADGVLRELRALRDGRPVDAVFGTISLRGGAGVASAQVYATGVAGGGVFPAQTDGHGVYIFPTLPAGTYKVAPRLPDGYTPAEAATVEVAAGVACRADTMAKPDGRIAGTVVDAAGKPLEGFITIEPVDPAEAAAARIRGGLPGDGVESDGKFLLPQLPPGHYRLVFHPGRGGRMDFRTTFYWPPEPGQAIELTLGQHIEGLQFKVP